MNYDEGEAVEVGGCQSGASIINYELRITNYELRITNYEL